MTKDWQIDYQQARLEEILEDGTVRCHLSPRNCKIKEGQQGFCGIKQVYDAGKHLELSTLMITDISDHEETAMKISDWMMENLDSTSDVGIGENLGFVSPDASQYNP